MARTGQNEASMPSASGLLQQLVAAFHQAGRPPGAIGIKRPHPRQRISHDRHRAEVLHGADDFLAAGASLTQAFVFGQQKIPEPEGGGRIVKLQTVPGASPFPAPRAGAAGRRNRGFAQPARDESRRGARPIRRGSVYGGGRAFERFTKAWRRLASRGEMPAASSASSGSTGKPETSRKVCDSARQRSQPVKCQRTMPRMRRASSRGLQPRIKPRVRPLKHVGDMFKVAVH